MSDKRIEKSSNLVDLRNETVLIVISTVINSLNRLHSFSVVSQQKEKEHYDNIKEILREYYVNIMRISQEYHESITRVLREYYENIKRI